MQTQHEAATIKVGDRTYKFERMKGVKAARILGELRALSADSKAIQERVAEFTREYEKANAIELDRVQAAVRFPRQVVYLDSGDPLTNQAGELVLAPSRLEAITPEQWEAAGGVYRDPVEPSGTEVGLALFDVVMEVAQDRVFRLVALLLASNADVREHWEAGPEAFDQWLDALGAELLDELFLDEYIDLGFKAYDYVVRQFEDRPDLRRRLGKLIAATPLGPVLETLRESMRGTSPSPSSPTGSTSSPADTAGPLTPSSTPPSTSSSGSPEGSSETTATEPQPKDAATPEPSTTDPATTPTSA